MRADGFFQQSSFCLGGRIGSIAIRAYAAQVEVMRPLHTSPDHQQCVTSAPSFESIQTAALAKTVCATKMWSQQRQRDQTNERRGLFLLGRFGSHIYCLEGCPKASKKNCNTSKVTAFSFGRTIQRAIKSDRPDQVPASFWQVRTHAMIENRSLLCELPHVIVLKILFYHCLSECWA